jgi:hypothetical protein
LLKSEDFQIRSNAVGLMIMRYDESDYCQWYWDRCWLKGKLERAGFGHSWTEQREAYWRLGRLACRWSNFRHYVNEVKPQWREVGKIYYADNSESVIEESADGRRRERELVAPHGDIC